MMTREVMVNTQLKVSVYDLQGKMQLTGRGHTTHTVQIDYTPPLGDDNGFTSLELLLVSLCSCSGHTIKFLLDKMGKKLDKLEVHAVGNRRLDTHPTLLTSIELQYDLKGDQLDSEAVERVIRMAEETYCPVWAMIRNTTAVTWKYSLH